MRGSMGTNGWGGVRRAAAIGLGGALLGAAACADAPTAGRDGASAGLAASAERPIGRTGGRTIYGLTAENELVSLASDASGGVAAAAIRGLERGDLLVGIDFRPSDLDNDGRNEVGLLYAVSRQGRIYVIDPATARARFVANLVDGTGARVALAGGQFGLGFNPVPDRLRIHTDAGQNLRINVDNGLTVADTALTYPGTGAAPRIVGTGYTNNDDDPATGTTLYAIDSALDALTVFNIPSGPNGGRMSVVGALGASTNDFVGFDIAFPGNQAYAALGAPGTRQSSIYTIDLATGAATLVKRIDSRRAPLVSIAVAPEVAGTV